MKKRYLDIEVFKENIKKKIEKITLIKSLKKQEINFNYKKTLNEFHETLIQNENIVIILDFYLEEDLFSILFFTKKKLSEKDISHSRLIKDKNSFIGISKFGYFKAIENKESHLIFFENYFFTIGFHKGNGIFFKENIIKINIIELSNQFSISEQDRINLMNIFNKRNIYDDFVSLRVFKLIIDP